MAVMKRGKTYYLRIRLFGKDVGISTSANSKTEAKKIEAEILRACSIGEYGTLDAVCREVCCRLFNNQGWQIPDVLSGLPSPTDELTLWKGVELCLKHPEVRDTDNRERLQQCFAHLVEKWGKEFPIRLIRIPLIKQYRVERQKEGACPATVNREKSALSKMFQILAEYDLIDRNPARDVKNLSEKSGQRQVYLSHDDFELIAERLPDWLQPVVQTAYYTGMRQGEILGLTRTQVKLEGRMIVLAPKDVKEANWKRVPIHKDLVPILREAMKVQSLSNDRIFLLDGHPLSRHSIKKPWHLAAGKLGLEPLPRFHDLRHTWKTNARRSGIDPEIRESVMGHWFREKSVTERYGRISSQELVRAIDLMTFDHGETEILVCAQ